MQQAHSPHNEGNSQPSTSKDGKPEEENLENGTTIWDRFLDDSGKEIVRRFREAIKWVKAHPPEPPKWKKIRDIEW